MESGQNLNPQYPKKSSFPFPLDRFQQQAIDKIEENCSVMVSAPTGAGKTVIAECVIRKAMEEGLGTIYTAPIKALSNQKYRDFREIYGDEVGIVTGDISLNPEAPILIMTTEIYRNSLFENSRRIRETGWVIFDEIHYLNDPERGTVWEEAILFTPDHIRILALSATVPNVDEIAEWINNVHKKPIHVIKEDIRPVPLTFSFQCQGKIFDDKRLLLRDGYYSRPSWGGIHPRQARNMYNIKPNRLDVLLSHISQNGQLPCIYFGFGRKRVEHLAYEAMEFNFVTAAEREKITALYESLLMKYQLQEEKSALEIKPLVELGIGFHHAGMLPSLKEVVEQLFTSRLLKLIFTTETFALGINMPAKCVIFDELQKFYGTGFRNLTTRDFYQMAGRAGRRGMDTEGFVYMRINPLHISYDEVRRIVYGEPEPILSQFNATYATLLNLFKNMKYELLNVYPDSLHYFQSSKKKRKEAHHLITRKLALLRDMGYLSDNGLTAKGEFAASLFGYELMLSEMNTEKMLETLSAEELCTLLSSLVFEPRKDALVPKLTPQIKRIQEEADRLYRNIHKAEIKYNIYPNTRPPYFHIATAVSLWARGGKFEDLFRHTTADEGELIRNFRMVIQLLREISHAANTAPALKKTAGHALSLINRDIVDAEKQLRA